MKAALLCPGPSLLRTFRGRGDYDRLYAVNRAPLLVADRVDVWCFTDWMIFLKHRPDYTPAIQTTKCAVQHLDRKGQHEALCAYPLRLVEDIDAGPVLKTWQTYTKTAAIVGASADGAKAIDIYGDDMQGIEDADGHTCQTDTRDDVRWNREREITTHLINWLWQRGVTVTRHGTA